MILQQTLEIRQISVVSSIRSETWIKDVFVGSLVDSWSMMSSPYPILALLAIYLTFVLKIGPNLMATREAFKMINATRVYNLYQIIGCIYFLISAPRAGFSYKYGWQCEKVLEPNESCKMVQFNENHWFFILFRASEFFETIVFVLRKKQGQVSFLHVYHHVAVVLLLWLFLKYNAGVQEGFCGLVNSAVHIPMYTYYLLSSYTSMRKFISVLKPLITAVQILQLLTLVVHFSFIILVCNASWLFIVQLTNVCIILVLFIKFYVQTYVQRIQTKRSIEVKKID